MSDREQIRKLGEKETIKNKWIMENNNFRYFNDKGELIVHLFRHQNNWKTLPILPAKSKFSKPNQAESGEKDRQIRRKVSTKND